MAQPNSFRRYGSIRIFRNGHVRLSPWTFPVLSYISITVMNEDHLTVDIHGRSVLDLDLSQGHIVGAGFRYSLTPDELRSAISDLRRAGNGLERWIVPALEFTSSTRAFRRDHPETHAIVPELLESCRDLPVAEQWKRVRAKVIANETAEETTPGKLTAADTPARKPRAKASKGTQPRKRAPRK